jgi:Xaa-Pro aminopeptidase
MRNLYFDKKTVCLVTDRLARKYLTGVDIAEGFLVTGDKTKYFTDARYFYAAKQKLNAVGIDAGLYQTMEGVFDFIKESGAERVLVDYTTTTVKEYNEYLSYGLKVGDYSNELIKMRAVKDETELKSIKRACKIAEEAFWSAIDKVKLGMSELQLKEEIEKNILALGGEGASFDIIVAFGENSAVPHHETGDSKLKNNSVILVDMGALVNGYMSDITRTVFFGEPDQEFIDRYRAVLYANVIAEQKIVAGVTAKEADAFARDYLKEEGLAEYFTHSLGHGVGYEIHEFPTLSKRCEEKLKENMVFTVEPGVYFDGQYGIRIEDTVVMKNGRVSRLFSDDKSLYIVNKAEQD